MDNDMNILSVGGELNHHGRFVCDALYNRLKSSFRRITTKEISCERVLLGYEKENDLPYNIVKTDIDIDFIKAQIEWADVIDYGNAPEEYLHLAVAMGKKVFIRIERLFKETHLKILHPSVYRRYYNKYIQYKNNENVYFLCVSAYAASDLKFIGINNNRILQWAYCPEFFNLKKEFDDSSPLKILWAGRMIKWKHPEIAIKIADCLKRRNIPFSMKIAGSGILMESLKKKIASLNLSDVIDVTGSMPPKDIRDLMIESDVFLATSDKNEGWGVVINEAMNAGCAVIASKKMGAAPVLVDHGINGFLYNYKDSRYACNIIKSLSSDRTRLRSLSKNAYDTICNHFSPEVYADVFIRLAEGNFVTNDSTILGRIINK